MTDTELSLLDQRLLQTCRAHNLSGSLYAVLSEPYYPFIPPTWNRILVVAEAQNLSTTNQAYVDWLRDRSPDERIRRLYLRFGDGIGVAPWDDASLKLAVAAMFPTEKLEEYAVCNAILWSATPVGGSNASPTNELMSKSTVLWGELLGEMNPRLIVTSGVVAEQVFNAATVAAKWGGSRIRLRLPSPIALSRVSGMFGEQDLLSRYPEVREALDRCGDLVLREYRQNKVFFACHAVSVKGTLT